MVLKFLKKLLASGFAEIFSLDYEETLAKLNSEQSLNTIAKRVDKASVDKLNKWDGRK